MSDQRSVQEQQWLASVLPSPQQLDHILGNDPAAALLGLAKTRAPIETGFVGDPGDDPELKKEFAVAQVAAAALKQNSSATLSTEQTQALHAFVHLLARPALRVVDDAVPAIPQSWERLKTAHESVIRRIRGVGRIDTSQRVHVGTGWFVAENLLLTNRHVAGALCGLDPHGDPAWLDKLPTAVVTTNALWDKDPSRRAVWDPAEMPSAASTAIGTITKIRAFHPLLDMALLDVTGVANSKDLVLRMHASPPGRARAARRLRRRLPRRDSAARGVAAGREAAVSRRDVERPQARLAGAAGRARRGPADRGGQTAREPRRLDARRQLGLAGHRLRQPSRRRAALFGSVRRRELLRAALARAGRPVLHRPRNHVRVMSDRALVIGLDAYEHQQAWELRAAVRDAVAFAKWVTAPGAGRATEETLTLLLSPHPDRPVDGRGVPSWRPRTRSGARCSITRRTGRARSGSGSSTPATASRRPAAGPTRHPSSCRPT